MDENKNQITFSQLTLKSWKQFQILFGANGACGGCWCMTWRLTSKEYEKYKGEGNRKKIFKLVSDRQPLGIMALKNKIPIGWCSVSPRHTFPRLENSKLLKRIDAIPVWSIVCLFIKKEFRRKNISTILIKEAAEYAFQKGATIVEAYPVIPKKHNMPDVFAWTGIASAYKKAGFSIAHKPNDNRLIMRKSKK
jgi:GNAT superfamily N-acetyltransferase